MKFLLTESEIEEPHPKCVRLPVWMIFLITPKAVDDPCAILDAIEDWFHGYYME